MNANPEQLWAQFAPVIMDLGVNVVSALVLVIIGWMVASWAQRAVRRGLGRFRDMDRTLVGMLAGVVRYFILVTVLVMVLGRFGVQTASILAALGAIGLAVGLALQGTLANIAAGVMLLLLRPFRVGDYVSANGHEGTVEEIGLFTTEMTTYDGIYQSVPNSGIWGGRIINYSRNPTRRHDILVGISYRDDIDRAQAVLGEVLQADQRVLRGPDAPAEPQVLVRELADSSVTLGLRFWTSTDDFWPAGFELRKAAKQALDANGITIPFPQRDVHLFEARGGAA
ncbi:MAG: mechanosensitive ion channel [Halofilum sp. (in: g-proteobacteria)]|nr:mechanosensitive ion channel [Halofilum sp. (in: g-proteobacteria)]